MAEGDSKHFTIGEFGAENVLDVALRAEKYVVSMASSLHSYSNGDIIYQKKGMTVAYSSLITPYFKDAVSAWHVEGEADTITEDGNGVMVTAVAAGDATLTLQVTIGAEVVEVSTNIHVVEHSINPLFKNRTNNGIKGINAIGDSAMLNGGYVGNANKLLLTAMIDGKRVDASMEDFDLKSMNPELVSVKADGTLGILGVGIATINASWKYNDFFGEDISTTITLNVVKDGVMIDNARDLIKATDEGKKVIIAKDIDFKALSDAEIRALLDRHKLPTTYDWTYYKNLAEMAGSEVKRPTVDYIIEFKNDVFGNGNAINTEAIAKAYDGNNPKYFKGPLDFVAVATQARVKGQDNISFLIRNKGVTIDNIWLKACDDESLIKEDESGPYMELNELNYVGNVLEIAGDDTSVINSRISNGRNVVRAYGGGTDESGSPITKRKLTYNEVQEERIDVRIDNCILSNAREFILKIGSNRALYSEGMEDVSLFEPALLTNKNGVPYDNKNKILDKDDKEFYDNNVLTDVTLKDSVLDTSGLSFTEG